MHSVETTETSWAWAFSCRQVGAATEDLGNLGMPVSSCTPGLNSRREVFPEARNQASEGKYL